MIYSGFNIDQASALLKFPHFAQVRKKDKCFCKTTMGISPAAAEIYFSL